MDEYLPKLQATVYISQSEWNYCDTPERRDALVTAKANQLRQALLNKWEDECQS